MTTPNIHEIVLAVWADLQTSPLGLASKLEREIAGVPVLRRTIERVCRVTNVARRVVYCPTEQADRVRAMLEGLPIEIATGAFALPARWPAVQAARKWAKTCWRGGLLGACAFDEDLVPEQLLSLVNHFHVGNVLAVPAHAALIDPQILMQQVAEFLSHRHEYHLGFTQAPPGLSGVIVTTDVLEQMVKSGQLVGSAVAYHPATACVDIIAKPCNLVIDPGIVQVPRRLLADSERGLRLIQRVVDALPEEKRSAKEITAWIAANDLVQTPLWPDEIEVELCAEWPTPKGYRARVSHRTKPIDAELIVRRVGELARQCDDLCVTLGGFGEPTRHGQFDEIVRGLHEAGVWSVAVATTGLIDEAMIDRLLALPIDVVQVLIDVPEPTLYERVFGVAGYEQAVHCMKELAARRVGMKRPLPLAVPEMIKTDETMELMDAFFDGWIRQVGASVVRGYNDHCGQLPNLAVSTMAPPNRRACRRIFSRMTILADGSIPGCEQDFYCGRADASGTRSSVDSANGCGSGCQQDFYCGRADTSGTRSSVDSANGCGSGCQQDSCGKSPIGTLAEAPLAETWRNARFTALREAQLRGEFSISPLCEVCTQWHRP